MTDHTFKNEAATKLIKQSTRIATQNAAARLGQLLEAGIKDKAELVDIYKGIIATFEKRIEFINKDISHGA